MAAQLSTIAQEFIRFADRECRGYSPLYERLSRIVAADEELLSLCRDAAPGQPIPNLFFAAVQFQLAREVAPLREFYPTFSEVPRGDDPSMAFKSFCSQHATSIKSLVAQRRVQTNEVARCTSFLPAFGKISRLAAGDWAFVEVGCSAGLNLLWDYYRYMFSDGSVWGPEDSTVKLTCTLINSKSTLLLPYQGFRPRQRIGIDLHPVDLTDQDQFGWMKALIWPEQQDRVQRLELAARIFTGCAPDICRGEATTMLPDILYGYSTPGPICVYHSYVMNQLTSDQRMRFRQVLADASSTRLLAEVACDYAEPPAARVRGYLYESGIRREICSMKCGPHGQWLETTLMH
jgi:hypothetical protein